MNIACVWEHNENDTLLYAANFPGAYTRGASLEVAVEKMPAEIRSYLKWKGEAIPENLQVTMIQEAPCSLEVTYYGNQRVSNLLPVGNSASVRQR